MKKTIYLPKVISTFVHCPLESWKVQDLKNEVETVFSGFHKNWNCYLKTVSPKFSNFQMKKTEIIKILKSALVSLNKVFEKYNIQAIDNVYELSNAIVEEYAVNRKDAEFDEKAFDKKNEIQMPSRKIFAKTYYEKYPDYLPVWNCLELFFINVMEFVKVIFESEKTYSYKAQIYQERMFGLNKMNKYSQQFFVLPDTKNKLFKVFVSGVDPIPDTNNSLIAEHYENPGRELKQVYNLANSYGVRVLWHIDAKVRNDQKKEAIDQVAFEKLLKKEGNFEKNFINNADEMIFLWRNNVMMGFSSAMKIAENILFISSTQNRPEMWNTEWAYLPSFIFITRAMKKYISLYENKNEKPLYVIIRTHNIANAGFIARFLDNPVISLKNAETRSKVLNRYAKNYQLTSNPADELFKYTAELIQANYDKEKGVCRNVYSRDIVITRTRADIDIKNFRLRDAFFVMGQMKRADQLGVTFFDYAQLPDEYKGSN